MAADVYTANDVKFDRDMRKLGHELRGLTEAQARPVVAKTLNTLGNKARTAAVKAVYKELKVRKQDVDKRIPKKFKRADPRHLRIVLVGLTKPIPIVDLMLNRVSRKTYSRRIVKGRPKGERKGFGPGRGGIKVGKLYFPDAYVAYVNFGRSGKVSPQVLRRKQRATWATPWKKGMGDAGNKRMPTEVLRMKLESAFEKRFRPEIDKVVERDWDKDYLNALKYYESRNFSTRRNRG